MKQNKWMKWLLGVGGISVFTLFLQNIDANNNDGLAQSQSQSQSQSNSEPNLYVDNQNMEVLFKEEMQNSSPEEREKQLMALDWEEGSWDVEYSNEVVVATPKTTLPYRAPAEQQTRRS